MTLKKFLKYVDSYTKLKIWVADPYDSEKAQLAYDNTYVYELPKKFIKNYRLIKAKENNYSEAIYALGDEYIRITVIKKEKKEKNY